MSARMLHGLLATLAAGAALTAAGPADALMRGGDDPPGQSHCSYDGANKPHGTIITITETRPDGSTYTYKLRCNNGNWEPARTMPSGAAAATGPDPGILDPSGF
jgi:hypothetical protein